MLPSRGHHHAVATRAVAVAAAASLRVPTAEDVHPEPEEAAGRAQSGVGDSTVAIDSSDHHACGRHEHHGWIAIDQCRARA